MRVVKSVPYKGQYLNSKGKLTHHKAKATAGVTDFIAVDGESIKTWIGFVDQPPMTELRYGQLAVGNDILEDWMTRHVVDCGNGRTTIVHGLHFIQILEFIYERVKRSKTGVIGFYLGFDFTQWLKTLPENRVRQLLSPDGIKSRQKTVSKNPTPFMVEYQGWEFDILDKKRFKFRKKLCPCFPNNCKCLRDSEVYICDVGPFWQCSFLKAIDPKNWDKPVLTDNEYATIKAGKDNRDSAMPGSEMQKYNRLENECLVRIMKPLNEAFKSVGVYLASKKWMGPGQAAEYWLQEVNKLALSEKLLADIPQEIKEAARMTYFGGWFEIMMHGIIPGLSYEYDINSAYPYVIANLPCLEHARYDSGIGEPIVGHNEIAFVYAKLRGDNPYIGTMLHRRDDMSILRPHRTEGWYVWSELQMAIRAGLICEVEYLEWHKIIPQCNEKPLVKVLELYNKRLEMNKESAAGKALKLLYNSMYGKFAQSIGSPKFGNAIYATLITSGCRERILEAIATHPVGAAHVAMIATDGIYFVSPHTVIDNVIEEYCKSTGKIKDHRIGMWDRAIKPRLTLFKPGVYWDDNSREKIIAGEISKFKSRGISAIDLAPLIVDIDAEFENWNGIAPDDTSEWFNVTAFMPWKIPSEDVVREYLERGEIPPVLNELDELDKTQNGWPIKEIIPQFAVISAKQALARNDWALAGTDVTNTAKLIHTANPEQKRNKPYVNYLEDGRMVYRTMPYEYPAEKRHRLNGTIENILNSVTSKPYEKRFGMEDPFSDVYLEQWGITEDGNISQIMNWALYE